MINADAVCGFVLEQIAWIRERAREGHALVGLFEDDLLLSGLSSLCHSLEI